MPKKIVIIAKCEDCPVTCCENRVMCGLIPDSCQLEDADRAFAQAHPTASNIHNDKGEHDGK